MHDPSLFTQSIARELCRASNSYVAQPQELVLVAGTGRFKNSF